MVIATDYTLLSGSVAAVEIARNLTEVQREILQTLKDKGPGLMLEVAVRVLKFQEDIYQPLRELQQIGLVETQTVSGGRFGNDLFTLTTLGDLVLRVLNDPSFQRRAAPETPLADARKQEAELLNKLGDASKEQGNLEKAIEYYQQALNITRGLASEESAR